MATLSAASASADNQGYPAGEPGGTVGRRHARDRRAEAPGDRRGRPSVPLRSGRPPRRSGATRSSGTRSTGRRDADGAAGDGDIESEVGIDGLATAWRARIGGAGPSDRRNPGRVRRPAEHRARLRPQPDRPVGGRGRAGAGQRRRSTCPGSVIILGTPAEESTVDNSGGKVHLVRAGAFDEVDASIMFHPSQYTNMSVEGLAGGARRRLHLPRQGGARLAVPLGGDQRARRRDAHVQRHQRAAPARPPGDPYPRRRDRRRRRPERGARSWHPAASGSALPTPRSWSPCSGGWSSAPRAAR